MIEVRYLIVIDYSASRRRSVLDHPAGCTLGMYESTTLSITYYLFCSISLLFFCSSALLLLLCALHIDYPSYTIGTIEA